ncbi:MAG: iron ABC transporter permease [Anderseniella sp.]|nr:iron ABC transporter permease [Anderseniella sp.]
MSRTTLIGGLAMLALVLMIASLLSGPAGLGPMTSLRALVAGGDEAAMLIMHEIRLPRALLAALVGFSLGVSGAALQGFLRNPLAEPGIIGVSASAALGAVLMFYTGVAGASLLALPAGALAGAAVCVAVLMAIAAARASTITLILAGVALSSLAAALTSLILNLSPNPFAAYEIIFWLLGSLKDRTMDHVWLALPVMALGWACLWASTRALDALTLGEEGAAGLGISMARTRWLIIGGVALSVGAATAVTGAIGFIGLIVPHLIRPLTDRLPGNLLLPSGLGGAALLTAADIAARSAIAERELNVGVVTALIGAPFFLWLVVRSRREVF